VYAAGRYCRVVFYPVVSMALDQTLLRVYSRCRENRSVPGDASMLWTSVKAAGTAKYEASDQSNHSVLSICKASEMSMLATK